MSEVQAAGRVRMPKSFGTADAAEGIKSFVERRVAVFQGR